MHVMVKLSDSGSDLVVLLLSCGGLVVSFVRGPCRSGAVANGAVSEVGGGATLMDLREEDKIKVANLIKILLHVSSYRSDP